MNKTAEELYPYFENADNDIAIREHNQRMYDCRDAYNKGLAAAPPPASEGEMADSKKVFDALVAIANNERLIADSVGDPILREMHLETQKAAQRICRTIYGATLPTREPEGEGKTLYQITYNELGERKKYLNGTSWEDIAGAEKEFDTIFNHVIKAESNGIIHIRTEYQIESINRRVVKKLNISKR